MSEQAVAAEAAPSEGLFKSEAPAQAAPVSAPAAPVKADWNSPEWKNFLPEDLRNEQSLKHINDIPAAIKSYINAQKMVGADKFLVPNKYATDDEWNGVYAKLGRPESPDKYDIKVPEGKPIAPEFIDGLKASAHKAG